MTPDPRLLGRPLRITAAPSVELGDPAAWIDARFPAAPDGLPTPAAPYEIRLHLVRDAAELLPSAAADEWQVGDAAAGARLRLDPAAASILAWDAAGDWASLEPATALGTLLVEALRGSGLVPLHAAVLARDGAGLALLGPSGAGKSTTLLRAARAGWRPVCEDLAWLDPASLQLARGDRGVRLWPDARDRYTPWLAPLPWRPEPDGKILLPWDELGHTDRITRLASVALLGSPTSHSDSDQPVARREIALALWEAAWQPLAPAHQQALGAQLASVATRIGAERLPLGQLPRGPR